jgi:hypothetical protein
MFMDMFESAAQRIGRNGNGNGNGNGEEPPPPPPRRNANLVIAGFEVTQGIQFFNFNGQGTGVAPDNSMPLAAGKTTVIRVYVDCRTAAGFPISASIDGECLVYKRLSNGTIEITTLSPITKPVVAQPANQINRGNANHTLNFRLDGWRCTGRVGFLITVWDSSRSKSDSDWATFASEPLGTQGFSFGFSTPEQFVMFNQIPVHGVRIIYTGPTDPGVVGPLGPPTEQEMASALGSFVSRLFPTSGINYTGSSIASFSGDLRVAGSGGCGPGWSALITMLQNMRSSSSDAGSVFVGLLPSDVPLGGAVAGGCGGAGAAAAPVFDSIALAHEIGHAYGRAHAPTGPLQIFPPPAKISCKTIPSNVDPNYPTYGNFPAGSIGEFGFDTTTSDVFNPSNRFDFMGYCERFLTWVSPYTWLALFLRLNVPFMGPGPVMGPGSPALVPAEGPLPDGEYLLLNFRMYRDGRVELLPSFHLPGVTQVPSGDKEAPVVVEFRAADGPVVGFYRCHFSDPHVDRDSFYRDFHEVMPWNAETQFIAFLRDGEEAEVIEVEERTPQVGSRLTAEREGDRVTLTWEGDRDRDRTTYLVRYSNNEGRTWSCVAADLTEPRVVADLAGLPGGERCLFQVAASSGIRTTVLETSPVTVPVKQRQPYILSPEPNSVCVQGESVVLQGTAFSPDSQTVPPDEIAWTSNVGGFLGYGYQIITHTLIPGLHRITLNVADGLGGEASASTLIKIRPVE